ncbi:MAG: tetratricopeptide repeat protein [Chitinophagales bacterium]
MNNAQILKLLAANREMIQRNMQSAKEDLEHLAEDCNKFTDATVLIYLELNRALIDMSFNSKYVAAAERSLAAIEKYAAAERIAFAWHYWLIGHCYASLGRHKLSTQYLDRAAEVINSEDKDYSWLMVGILIARVMNNEMQDELQESSLEYAAEALKLVERIKDPLRKAGCDTAMGNVLHNRGRYEEALTYFMKSLRVYEQHYNLSDMAGAYSNVGTSYIGMGDLKKAEEYLLKSVELRNQFGSPDQLSISYHNLAIVYKQLNDLLRCKEMLLRCCDILERNGSTVFLNATRKMLADVEKEMTG